MARTTFVHYRRRRNSHPWTLGLEGFHQTVINHTWKTISIFICKTVIQSSYINISWQHDLYSIIINTMRQRQNGGHFADDIFKCIFFNENIQISITISLKFVPKGSLNNIPPLVQIMAWHWPGAKPLSEPMICVTRPHWVNGKKQVS